MENLDLSWIESALAAQRERIKAAPDDYAFTMLDGCLEATIYTKTGAVLFPHPIVSLSPHNLAMIFREIDRYPEAKEMMAKLLGKRRSSA